MTELCRLELGGLVIMPHRVQLGGLVIMPHRVQLGGLVVMPHRVQHQCVTLMDFSGDVELTWIFFAQFMMDEPVVLKDIF